MQLRVAMRKKLAPSAAQTALRLPGQFLARADRLSVKIGKDPMLRVTRSTVLKMAIGRGLDALEAEYK
jgi:predicted DNA-binding protein